VKPIALYAAAMLVAASTTGALTPNAPRVLHQSLFDLCVAFALVTFAALWLTPSGPDAVHSKGA
jgi:hypothetical protein